MSRRVVIIGAGIVGCSVAYELSRLGWHDLVVLEQGPLFATGGSTSHAPGLVFQTNPSKTMTEFARATVEQYSSLQLDGVPCFYPVGSIEVATTPQRWKELYRRHGWATSWGLESRILSPEECAATIPLLDPSRILGGYHVPSDGIARAVAAAEAMARAAMAAGAAFHPHTEVTGIERANGRVTGVLTSGGRFEADVVVCCAGIWGQKLARLAGVDIPLVPMQHQLVWTEPLPELAGEEREVAHPILRHQDRDMYFRHRRDQYAVGSYQHDPLPLDSADLLPHGEARGVPHPEGTRSPSVWEFTPELFEDAWAEAKTLLPALENARLAESLNGIFSFTTDGFPLLGESKRLAGFWLAEAIWITHACGAGRSVAQWIASGVPEIDLRQCDVNRFDAHAYSSSYVERRSTQNYIEVYDIIHPLQSMEEPRPLRVSPFYARQRELGGCFFESMGWERPQWYEANAPLVEGRAIPERDPWSAQFWSAIAGAEHLATRERVALYDMTSLKKVEVAGPGALAFLERLTTGIMDRPPGTVTYTLLLDERGGIKSDITVARLGKDRFQIGCNGPLDLVWLDRHLPADGSVQVRDITSGTSCLGVWGPRARHLVQELSRDDFSETGIRYFRAREAYIREVPVLAMRLSYVGELGWELYVPTEYGLRLWDLLWQVGQRHGVIAGGRGAFDSLRLEKGYRFYGRDMWSEHDPYEAGLGFAVNLDKGDFVGRDALLRRREEGPRRLLTCLTLDDPTRVVMGSEPVYAGDAPVGFVTSAAYGYSIGRGIAYAWLPPEQAGVGTGLRIEYFGEALAATVRPEPLFDPEMARMRPTRRERRPAPAGIPSSS